MAGIKTKLGKHCANGVVKGHLYHLMIQNYVPTVLPTVPYVQQELTQIGTLIIERVTVSKDITDYIDLVNAKRAMLHLLG